MQTVSVERYVQMVRDMGIEEAYKQRFRGTGRTVRDVLALAHMVSAGDKIMIITDGAPGNTLDGATEILHLVRNTLNQLGMQFTQDNRVLRNAHNGGELRVYSNTEQKRGPRHKEYKLHAS